MAINHNLQIISNIVVDQRLPYKSPHPARHYPTSVGAYFNQTNCQLSNSVETPSVGEFNCCQTKPIQCSFTLWEALGSSAIHPIS